jgi:excisionase family DNA binding protein
MPASGVKLFYSVAEVAALLHVGPATLYRAIREDAFPAVKIRSRVIIPAKAIETMIEHATATGRCIDVSAMMESRRHEQLTTRVTRAGW